MYKSQVKPINKGALRPILILTERPYNPDCNLENFIFTIIITIKTKQLLHQEAIFINIQAKVNPS